MILESIGRVVELFDYFCAGGKEDCLIVLCIRKILI